MGLILRKVIIPAHMMGKRKESREISFPWVASLNIRRTAPKIIATTAGLMALMDASTNLLSLKCKKDEAINTMIKIEGNIAPQMAEKIDKRAYPLE